MAQEWHIPRAEQDQLRLREPQEGRRGLSLGLHGRSDRAVRRRVPRQQPARGHQPREARDAEARVRQVRARHADRRQLDAAHRRRRRACCWRREEWAAKRGLPVQAYLTYRQTSANNFVGGDGLLMAPTIAVSQHARARRPDAAGFRLLRDPRGVRRAGAVHAESLGGSGLLQEACSAATRRWARSTAPSSTSRARRLAFGHPFAATGARIVGNLAKLLSRARRPRPHLGLHRRRHGRRRNPRRLGYGGSPARGLIHSVTLFSRWSPAAAMVRSLERPWHEKGTNVCKRTALRAGARSRGFRVPRPRCLRPTQTRAEPAQSAAAGGGHL